MERAPWYIVGPVLGLLIVGLRAALNKPFGASGGYVELTERARRRGRLGSSAWLLAGLGLGGFAFATMTGSFGLAVSYPAAAPFLPGPPALQLALLSVAGVAMGFGARTAGGCTSGHGLSGTSLGSPASLVATMTFFATAVALANLLARLGG